MTHIFSGAEKEAFASFSGVFETTSGGGYDSSYQRQTLLLDTNSTPSLVSPVFSSSYTTFWIHWTLYINASNGTGTLLTLYNSSGTAVFRARASSAGNLIFEYWNGSSWTAIGSNWTFSGTTSYTCDLKVVCGGSGSFEFYAGGTLITSGSASMTSVDNIQKFMFGTVAATNQGTRLSEIMCATTSTVGCRLESETATSNGTDTDGTGSYTDIDEGTLNDSDFKNLPSSGNKANFKSPARTQGGSGTAKAVTVTARMSTDSSQSIKFYLLIGGTRYYSSSIALTASLTAYLYSWETNPSTGSAWVLSDAQAASLEWGVEVQ